eukprot:COSAG06_NODE_3377_length_5433_cov_2.945819_4_plen_49_part_00
MRLKMAAKDIVVQIVQTEREIILQEEQETATLCFQRLSLACLPRACLE